jgi:tRNA1(Val) A37 N6-methylase TrmN6
MDELTPWPDDARRDALIGDWHIYQRTGGHRTSTDDLITAWYAVHRHPDRPGRYLDLGCGIGSVMLMVSHKLRPPVAHGIEAQAQSVTMARRAIDELPPNECAFRIEHSDFRAAELDGERYDVVTGSPPYFPLNAGVLPNDPQRRACRFEERGGVEGYVQTAARAMGERARFYVVYQTRWNDRLLRAASEHSLHVTGRADFLMRHGRSEPFLTVFELSRQPVDTPHRFDCAVRDADGQITREYQRLREELGVG